MKKLVLCLSVYALTMGALFAQSDYYWYKGKKIPVSTNNQKHLLVVESQSDSKTSLAKAPGLKIKSSNPEVTSGSLIKHKSFQPGSYDIVIVEANQEIKKLDNKDIIYQAPYYVNEQGDEAPLSNQFYVKLKNAEDVKLLEQLAGTHNVQIKGNSSLRPLWYTLAATRNSTGNALDLANLFYESGKFAVSEPEFLFEIKSNCANDYYFSDQWGLKNTGPGSWTAGIDIKACGAWECTKGDSSIIVAVVDDGVQLNHPDMPNMHALSYDAHTGTSPSVLNGTHGTPCAGIIGAAANNIGITGVAPNVQIMSISIMYGGGGSTPAAFADAITFAWQNGADVISNSWYYDAWWTTVIPDAIADAIALGRGGKGTTVVFAAGNTNGTITNPAGLDPDILVVGAGSPCGERKSPTSCDGETWWGSSYGTQLDVMAPGVKIPSTTTGSGYTLTFNGTSSAAPHVSGIVALLYSMDPSLTWLDVVDIIEQTSQKVGSYTYSSTIGRPNGNWNSEAGYGLVDAEAAVATLSKDYRTVFNVPDSSTIPHGFRQYSCIFTLGCGGPDLSNVFNGVFNWWGGSSGLYQFTLETNSSPYYVNITDHASYSLHTVPPQISISPSIGIPGLAGDYWVTIHNGNVVLVSKSGKFALYFSSDCTPPSLRQGIDYNSDLTYTGLTQHEAMIAPNPFLTEATLYIPESMGNSSIMISNIEGQIIETLSGKGAVKLGASYPAGMYLVRIVGNDGVRQTSFVKQ